MTSPNLTCASEQASRQRGRLFDLSFWRERVEKRRKRAIERGMSEAFAMQQYLGEMACVRDLDRLIKWCTKRGLTVYFKKHENGTYDEYYKSIMIAANASPAKQVVYLLHECGHHLIHQHPGEPNRFAMGYDQTDPRITHTFQHRLACLEEEMEAWQRGRNLAKKLKLRIDDDALEYIRINCLKSYVKWAVSKKDYE
ncbi:MAG: hypothetical protein EBU90_29780 [Proteobacteria bacterium]|nr:hypothetical protein [Pseudomonadota bacterium]